MTIHYNNQRDVLCYKEFVENPQDRKAMKAFVKAFSIDLLSPAKKLHDRLIECHNACIYNALYGGHDNNIEKKQGCRNNEPLILKVRITRGYRKFLHNVVDINNRIFTKTKDWQGDFILYTQFILPILTNIIINNNGYT